MVSPAKPYLLDTNALLHWIRGKQIAENIDGQFISEQRHFGL